MNLSAHPFLVHPHTKEPLKPVGLRKPRLGEVGPQPIWPCIGASEDDPKDPVDPPKDPAKDPVDPPADPPKDPADDGKGFPANTPVADMTAEQQAAYWKHHSRKHEDVAKAYQALGKDITPERVRELLDGQKSAEDKALEAAKAEGRTETLAEVNRRTIDNVVDQRLAAAKLKREDVPALEVVDLTKCTDDDGYVDMTKVDAVLKNILPASSGGQGGSWPDMGQGNRGDKPKKTGGAAGRSEAERRFKKQ